MIIIVRIGIIGSKGWQSRRKLQDILRKLKTLDEPVTVLGQGGTEGAGAMVKKLCIAMGLDYAEYNPSYSGHNLYSAMPESYFGKQYHFTQLLHRMTLLADSCDKMIVLLNGDIDPQIKAAIKRANKRDIPVVILE